MHQFVVAKGFSRPKNAKFTNMNHSFWAVLDKKHTEHENSTKSILITMPLLERFSFFCSAQMKSLSKYRLIISFMYALAFIVKVCSK